MSKSVFAVAALMALAGAASAQIRINEVLHNPPGADQGQEFFELIGPAGASLSGLFFVVIEGDGGAAGTVDQVIDLSAFSLGSNGLFLARDTASVLDADAVTPGVQGPDAATTIRLADFIPDIENGTQTYLLVSGFTASVSIDLDTDNDGILDVRPWTSVLDAVGYKEDDVASVNIPYAASLGFFDFDTTPDASGGQYTGDALARGLDGLWYLFDVLAPTMSVVGPFTADPNETTVEGMQLVVLPTGANFLTPGRANVIPTTGSLALLGVAGLVVARRRRA